MMKYFSLLLTFFIESIAFSQKTVNSFDDKSGGIDVIMEGTLSSDVTVPARKAIVKSYLGHTLLEKTSTNDNGSFSTRIEIVKGKKSFLVFHDSAKTRQLVIEILINHDMDKNKLYKMSISVGFSNEYQGSDISQLHSDFYLLYNKEADYFFISESKDGVVD